MSEGTIHPKGSNLPLWFQKHLDQIGKKSVRKEIELKYIVPRNVISNVVAWNQTPPAAIAQYYLDSIAGKSLFRTLAVSGESESEFQEWRIRRKGDSYYFTAKGAIAGSRGIERREFETSISQEQFEQSKSTQGIRGLSKSRRSWPVSFSDGQIVVECDDYQLANSDSSFDFVVCELEVES